MQCKEPQVITVEDESVGDGTAGGKARCERKSGLARDVVFAEGRSGGEKSRVCRATLSRTLGLRPRRHNKPDLRGLARTGWWRWWGNRDKEQKLLVCTIARRISARAARYFRDLNLAVLEVGREMRWWWRRKMMRTDNDGQLGWLGRAGKRTELELAGPVVPVLSRSSVVPSPGRRDGRGARISSAPG